NDALIRSAVSLAKVEQKTCVDVLRHLMEIERRRLYAEQGYPSLFSFTVEVLGYSEGAAGRRIAAMRLMRDLPEAEDALEKGSIGLTVASALHHIFRRENLTRKRKRSLLEA